MRIVDKYWPILTALALLVVVTRKKVFRRISEADIHEISELVLDPAWEEPPAAPPES